MSLSWVACEARTGRVLERLPGLKCRQVGATIGRYEVAQGMSLPLADAPPGWERAVLEGATFLVLTDGPDAPLWGGLVLEAPRDAGNEVALTVATAEVYLDMRYVGDETYAGVGQNAIVEDLVTKYVATGPNGGIPITVVKVDGDGTLRDRTYTDAANQTVLSQVSELGSVGGGVEVTIRWRHLTAPERYVPVLYVGTRLGVSPPAGLRPGAVFRMPGSVSAFRQARSFARGKGANHVTAWSSGEGGARPTASHTVADPDRPTIEHRWSPSTNITDAATLAAHAQRKGEAMAGGVRALTLVADYATAPRLGRDWNLGDDIGFEIGATRTRVVPTVAADVFTDTFTDDYATAGLTAETVRHELVPAFPGGLVGTARALGWRMTLTDTPTISPVLAGSEGML